MVSPYNNFYSPPFLIDNFVSPSPPHKHSPYTITHIATDHRFQKKPKHNSPIHALKHFNIPAPEHVSVSNLNA